MGDTGRAEAERKQADAGSADGPGRFGRGPLEKAIGPRVRILRNLLTVRSVGVLAPFGLRTGALTAMSLISANEGCSQADLARELGLDKSAVVSIVDDLEKGGLAVRDRSPEDRRRNLLSLTAKGEETMLAMYEAAVGREHPVRAALTPEEHEQLLSLLDRAYDALLADGTGG
jgi:DNA-binding MarR family transcriptional regulator